MTVAFLVPRADQASLLSAMTFPNYRPLLAPLERDTAAVAAYRDGVPIALALAQRGQGQLLSIFVAAEHRRQGVGGGLLRTLQRALADSGCSACYAIWMDSMVGADGFRALLLGQAWSAPAARMIIYRAELARLAEAKWILNMADAPEGHAIVAWSSLAPEQIKRLRQAIRFEGWVPADLDPFQFAGLGIDGALSEPQLNFAYTVWGDVVGWNFGHRINAGTVRASCTFVRPNLQNELTMLALWRHAFFSATRAGYRRVSWAVSVTRPAMMKFNDRYMSPYLSQRVTSWVGHKVLVAGGDADKSK
jgi:GNAT superfamily N-acetyltransferase